MFPMCFITATTKHNYSVQAVVLLDGSGKPRLARAEQAKAEGRTSLPLLICHHALSLRWSQTKRARLRCGSVAAHLIWLISLAILKDLGIALYFNM